MIRKLRYVGVHANAAQQGIAGELWPGRIVEVDGDAEFRPGRPFWRELVDGGEWERVDTQCIHVEASTGLRCTAEAEDASDLCIFHATRKRRMRSTGSLAGEQVVE